MANTIQIKRSAITNTPASLAEGELAYSEASGYLFIGETDGSVTAVGGETVVTKLAGIDDNANNYSLPTASGATLGGIKVGTGLAIDGSGVLTATGSGGLNEAQVDARVQLGVDAIVAGAPAALDTLNELAAALGDDPDTISNLTTQIGTKLAKSSNLADLTNAATARSNLGLDSMALQSAASVTITGGSVNGVVLDGGTF
ncbi:MULTISPECIES: hypothetical protein [Endozoicomonas]|uniref:hypothetical protein n=3 Tax=Endozoicomonadaceae TaxID=2066474 RepID=UPI0008265A70|nr:MULTISPECIES: hypothetical protein [Endozoicomonas]USE35873.1 alpha-hydroxy-acid oxidizing protein [Endozoicomonas sp. SCSIO W0465]